MAIYKAPGVYFSENIQSLGSSAYGFNRTGIIGSGQTYTNVNNLELEKSRAVVTKSQIITTNVTPWIGEGTAAVGSYVVWTDNQTPATGAIEFDLVNAHWIGTGNLNIGDYVKLIDTTSSYGYQEAVQGSIGALQVIATIDGNGFNVSQESVTDAMVVIAVPANTDNILLSNGVAAASGDILSITGIGNIPGFFNYVLDTDYTINNSNTMITWISNNKPSAGSAFYITYKLNKSLSRGDFEPVLLFNQTAVKEIYGPEYLNNVVQPLTLGADLVLEGQTLVGGGVYCCQVTDDTDASYQSAINKMMLLNIQTIIILKQDSIALRNYLIQNIATCSSALYGKERTTFIVPNDTLSVDGIVAQRSALMNDRITYFANQNCTITLTDDSTQETSEVPLSAIYACCNLSGIEGNPEYTYSEPMLRKSLSSRITLTNSQIFDPSTRNYLCSNYLSMLDFNENTNLSYIFDIYTTDSENVITETRQVRRVTDLIRDNLRRQLSVYIGQKNTQATASSAQLKVQSILNNFITAGEIKDFKNITTGFDTINPKQLNVSFTYLPLLEIKWVQVNLSISLD